MTGGRTLPAAALGLLGLVFAAAYFAAAHFLPPSLVAAGFVGLCFAFFVVQDTAFAVLMAIVAMLFSPELHLGQVILRAEDLIVPVVFLKLVVAALVSGRPAVLRRGPLDLPMLVLLGVLGLSSWVGFVNGRVDTTQALWLGKLALMFLLYWIALNFFRHPGQVRIYLNIVILVFFATACYALTQVRDTQLYSAQRLTAPFEGTPEPNTLGGYLTLIYAMALALAVYEENPRLRKLYGVAAAVAVVPILFTLSRSAYISFVAVTLFLGLLARRPALLLGAVAGLAVLVLAAPDVVVTRVLSTFDPSREYGIDPSVMERVLVWRKALHTLSTFPLLGRGFHQFIIDSQFACIIIESGLLGLAAWLWLLGACAAVAQRLRRSATSGMHRAIAVGYLVGFAGLLIHAIGNTSFYIVRMMGPFWFLTGIVAYLEQHERLRANVEAAAAEPEEWPATAVGAGAD